MPGTRFERAHFASYGDFALGFEVVYHVLSPDYGAYRDVQQDINLRIFERFAVEGVEFAYPTQAVWLRNPSDSSGIDAPASGSILRHV